jgi:hypothetical protein
MVVVSQVPGQEEDHVVAVATGHELQTPKLDHRGQWKWMFGVSHPKNGGKTMLARSGPLPGAPTVSVRTREGPRPMSKCVLRAP